MATGDYGAGLGPAGFDPVTLATPRSVLVRVSGRFDGVDRAFLQDADGRLTDGHWVDMGMAIGLLFKRGSITSVPTAGHTFHLIENFDTSNLQREVEDRVKQANPVARLLANGDATITRVEYEVREHGGLAVAVSYTNNRLAEDNVRTVRYPS